MPKSAIKCRAEMRIIVLTKISDARSENTAAIPQLCKWLDNLAK